MGNNKIYVDADEFERLCRLDGKMDSLISYINLEEYKERKAPKYEILDRGIVKAIIGMGEQ